MNYKAFSLLFGFFVWLLATFAFRYAGHLFFLSHDPVIVTTFFTGVVPVLYFLIKFVFKKYQLSESDRLTSAVLLALPGMFLDVFSIMLHQWVFPSFSLIDTIFLASWLLWVYAVVLLMGLLPKKTI